MPEQVQTVIIPEAKVGAFAFKNYRNPSEMAADFGQDAYGIERRKRQETDVILTSLHWLLNNEVVAERLALALENSLGRLDDQEQNYLAAKNLADAFGEVEATDRGNVGMLAVFNALQHNVEEAACRRERELVDVVELVAVVVHFIQAAKTKIEERIKLIKAQSLEDQQTEEQFKANAAGGYEANVELSRAGASFMEELNDDNAAELKRLQVELELLETMQYRLNAYLWL